MNNHKKTHGDAQSLSGMSRKALSQRYLDVLALVPTALVKAMRELQLLLTNPAKAGVTRHQEEGKVDRRTVYRALGGAKNVKKRNWRKPQITTAVMVIMDGSGSMAGQNWHNACLMMCALGTVLAKAKATFSLASFRSGRGGQDRVDLSSHRRGAYNPSHKSPNGYSRVSSGVDDMGGNTSCSLVFGKPFDRMLSQSHAGMARMMADPDSGTPDFSAYSAGVRMLAKVKADRKILITLADGSGQGDDAIQSMTKLANIIDVETMGICIGGHQVRHGCYNSQVTVRDADDLTRKVVAQLTKTMGRHKQAKKVYA